MHLCKKWERDAIVGKKKKFLKYACPQEEKKCVVCLFYLAFGCWEKIVYMRKAIILNRSFQLE